MLQENINIAIGGSILEVFPSAEVYNAFNNEASTRDRGMWVFNISSMRSIGDDIYGSLQADGSFDTSGMTYLSVLFYYYGPNAWDDMNLLLQRYKRDFNRCLSKFWLSLADYGGINGIYDEINYSWDNGCRLDVNFNIYDGHKFADSEYFDKFTLELPYGRVVTKP